MNKIVDLKEAIIAYINGKKVRRYFTSKEESYEWFNNWVWFENNKQCQTINFDYIELINPLESFNKFGYNYDKLWEIKGD